MSDQELPTSIAYCGLVCGMCDLLGECTGCGGPTVSCDRCDKARCEVRACNIENGREGCWDCPGFPCAKGRFGDKNRGQTVGFCSYIRDFGREGLVVKLLENEAAGIRCGLGGAYRHRSLEEVERLLR